MGEAVRRTLELQHEAGRSCKRLVTLNRGQGRRTEAGQCREPPWQMRKVRPDVASWRHDAVERT